jgi:hypothetical protein
VVAIGVVVVVHSGLDPCSKSGTLDVHRNAIIAIAMAIMRRSIVRKGLGGAMGIVAC